VQPRCQALFREWRAVQQGVANFSRLAVRVRVPARVWFARDVATVGVPPSMHTMLVSISDRRIDITLRTATFRRRTASPVQGGPSEPSPARAADPSAVSTSSAAGAVSAAY